MSYENYTLEDFLTNREFKNWVLNPDTNTQLFWIKWMDSHREQKETILKARELILSYTFKESEKILQEEQDVILEAILGTAKKSTSRGIAKKYVLLYAVAACLLIGFSVVIYSPESFDEPAEPAAIAMIVKQNPVGQKSVVRLPDGTKVWLNSESQILFPETFVDERNVALNGEAFFEVFENAKMPFNVVSNGVITTALGTTFNVRAYTEEREVEVMLVTGKVAVGAFDKENKDPQEKIFINPGEQAIYDVEDRSITKTIPKDKSAILWRDGIISFKKAGFEQIEQELERWYGVNIEGSNLHRKLHYTGDFDNESLERVLERMAFTEKFTFEINEDNIKIKFE